MRVCGGEVQTVDGQPSSDEEFGQAFDEALATEGVVERVLRGTRQRGRGEVLPHVHDAAELSPHSGPTRLRVQDVVTLAAGWVSLMGAVHW